MLPVYTVYHMYIETGTLGLPLIPDIITKLVDKTSKILIN
jgi:hypothetical protein